MINDLITHIKNIFINKEFFLIVLFVFLYAFLFKHLYVIFVSVLITFFIYHIIELLLLIPSYSSNQKDENENKEDEKE
jgi:Ca2+/Na+ antiporter